MSSYSEQLRDPRWQKKRLQILERDKWMCQCCGAADKTLNVHHTAYADGYPWQASPDVLVTLCENCHQDEHEKLSDQLYFLFRFLGQFGVRTAEDVEVLISTCELANGEMNLRNDAECLAIELLRFQEQKTAALAKGGWNA